MWYDFRKEISEENLFGDQRSEHDYHNQANGWREETQFFERRLTMAPFYGVGAAVITLGSMIVTSSSNLSLVAFVLPTAWLFLVSLILLFLAGGFYVGAASNYQSEYRTRGNAQSDFHNYRDKLIGVNKAANEKKWNKLLAKKGGILGSVNSKINKANDYCDLGDRNLKKARIFAVFGIGIFIIGLVIPLITFSVKMKFIGQ